MGYVSSVSQRHVFIGVIAKEGLPPVRDESEFTDAQIYLCVTQSK